MQTFEIHLLCEAYITRIVLVQFQLNFEVLWVIDCLMEQFNEHRGIACELTLNLRFVLQFNEVLLCADMLIQEEIVKLREKFYFHDFWCVLFTLFTKKSFKEQNFHLP